MEFTFHDAEVPDVDALVLVCAPDDELADQEEIRRLDGALEGRLLRRLDQKRFRGKRGQALRLDTLGRLPAEQLTLVGAGDAHLTAERWLALGEQLGGQGRGSTFSRVALQGVGVDLTPGLATLTRGLLLGRYAFRRYRTRKDDTPPEDTGWTQIAWMGVDRPRGWDPPAVQRLVAAVSTCRDLVNEPAAAATPAALAEEAQGLASDHLTVDVLDADACEQRGMGLFLAVTRGSREPPAFIHTRYAPEGARGPKVALVGKGITFDSGGLSLKTAAGMKDMKSDMAGGAVVLAVMSLLQDAGLPLEVHGIVPACENMPSGDAYRLGDVLRGLDGPSVEIVNTDAEGRLVLADGLAFARQQGCDMLVDLATLTGACVVALGEHTAGLFGNDDDLAAAMLDAARDAGESLWRLPLSKPLGKQLDSTVADCKNSGGRWGGAITAALFLQKFVGDTRWLHLDIAGPAFRDKGGAGRPAGGTGYGVATVLGFLTQLAAAHHQGAPA